MRREGFEVNVLEDLIGVLDSGRRVAYNIELVPFVGNADAGGVGPVPKEVSEVLCFRAGLLFFV